MKAKNWTMIFGLALVLAGLSGCASTGSSVEAAPSGPAAAAIKLPDSLFCTRTAVEARLTVTLAPLKETLGNPEETLTVILMRSGHEVGILGKVGGGAQFQDFAMINLAPADAAVFDTSASVRFTLKVVNGRGDTLAMRNVVLMMQ
ncbi:MAG: hypothetical protein ACYDH3_07570 [Candidatus Aminicenantales bacterium]